MTPPKINWLTLLILFPLSSIIKGIIYTQNLYSLIKNGMKKLPGFFPAVTMNQFIEVLRLNVSLILFLFVVNFPR
jgi:hypothetical protein